MKNYKKGFQAKAFSFSPEEDIPDLRRLAKDIGACSTSQLDRIDRLLRSETISGAINCGYQEEKTLYAREYPGQYTSVSPERDRAVETGFFFLAAISEVICRIKICWQHVFARKSGELRIRFMLLIGNYR